MQTKTLSTGNIEVTVGLPLFNADKIYWLALEGLCNQKNVTFKWELLICEEKHSNQVEREKIRDYVGRLKEVGCVQVVYVELDEWVNLTTKWRRMFEFTEETSKAFFLQAADCYSQENRLRDSYDLIKCGCDWVDYTNGYFYNIATDEVIKYNANALTNLDMAFSTKNISRVPSRHKNKGIDKHLFQHLNIKEKKTLERLGGVDTDGHNNISKRRSRFYRNTKEPFTTTQKSINEIGLPNYIVERLTNL